MPLRICPSCHGRRVVRHGVAFYRCPRCNGFGGIPLAAQDPVAVPAVPDGASRAAAHLAGTMPRREVRRAPSRGSVPEVPLAPPSGDATE
jgi:hypothetical protein